MTHALTAVFKLVGWPEAIGLARDWLWYAGTFANDRKGGKMLFF